MAVKCILTGQTPSVLDGVTENVQTQINNKQAKITADGILKGDGNGNITAVDETETELVDLTVSHITGLQGALDDKVSKVTGKDLSTNDYTTAEKTKLSGIETGAQKNTITGVKGGSETSYRTGNVNITATNIGLGNVDNTSDKDKPISTATQTALNGKQATVTGAATTITGSNLTASRALVSNANGKVAVSDVTSTELGYLDGVTSAIQTQLNGKVPTSRTVNGKALNANITLGASDVGALSTAGGTLTGNLTGKYITGTWLQTTDVSDKAGDFATIDSSGWIYKRTADEVATDIGNPVHQNLFVNGFFQVWQVNSNGSYNGVPVNAYVCDCWRILSSDGNKSNVFQRVGPSGIKNVSGANCTMIQFLTDASSYNGKTLTYSRLKLLSSGEQEMTIVTKTASGWTDTTDIIAQFGTGSNYRWINPGETVVAAKLEFGDKQTLAHKDSSGTWVLNEIPNYTTELMRCKRFLSVCRGVNYFHRADAVTANNLQFFIPTGVPLRSNPSNHGTPHIFPVGNTSNELSGFSYQYTTQPNGTVRVVATKNGHGLSDGVLYLPTDFYFNAQM